MNHNPPHFRPRTALLIGALFVSTPALAQEGQTVTPPQVVPTVPQTQQVTPPPAQAITPPRIVPTTVQAVPDTPEVQPAPAAREAAPRRTQASRPAPRRVTQTTTTTTRTVTPAEPVAETPPAAIPPAPPVAEVPAPATAPIQTPVEQPAPVEATTTTTATEQGSPAWPWLAGGVLLVLAGLAFLLFRRRSEQDEYAEEYPETVTTAEPVAVVPVEQPAPRHEPEVAPRVAAAPLAAAPFVSAEPVPVADVAPVAAEKTDVSSTDEEDLAGIADGTAPVSHRPWIELGMRPLRAGISADEALVEVELIVGNAGDMAAENVRISTFMLPAGATSSDLEEMMIERSTDAIPPLTIKAGEGKTVDATLAVAKAQLTEAGADFSPTVFADARYRLPDGSEGRTSAAFRIGLTDEDRPGIESIALDNRGMHENVAAELEGVPERA
jgi:hypothetical protein